MKKVEGNTLAEGEHTGHVHRVQVAVMARDDGLREFSGATKVTHEEHKPITLPTKEYVSGIKTEHDYFLDMERQVKD